MPNSGHFGPACRNRDEPFTLPAVHALHLADLVAASGIAQEELFGPLGLDRAALAVPGAQLEVPVVVRALREGPRADRQPGHRHPARSADARVGPRIPRLRGDDGVDAPRGARDGDALRPDAHERARASACTSASSRASLVIEERADFGAARDAILFALAVGIWQIGDALTGRELTRRGRLRLSAARLPRRAGGPPAVAPVRAAGDAAHLRRERARLCR